MANTDCCNPSSSNPCPKGYPNSMCVEYTGATLHCIDVVANDRLDAILSKINEAICELQGTFIQPGNVASATIQFIVGDSGSYISDLINVSSVNIPVDGDVSTTITFPGIIRDSVTMAIDGFILPRDLTDRTSYGVVYSSTEVTLNIFPQFATDQLIIITFNYTPILV